MPNIHPAIVHFPIALLTVYALFECLRFDRLLRERSWMYVKAAFVILGELGALAAIYTGGTARRLFQPDAQIVRAHSFYGTVTAWIFGVLAVVYLVNIFEEYIPGPVVIFCKSIFSPPVMVILAMAGLVAVFVTGALGGTMVYGPNTDPFVRLINNLLFPTP